MQPTFSQKVRMSPLKVQFGILYPKLFADWVQWRDGISCGRDQEAEWAAQSDEAGEHRSQGGHNHFRCNILQQENKKAYASFSMLLSRYKLLIVMMEAQRTSLVHRDLD